MHRLKRSEVSPSGFAEFKRELIRERAQAGLSAARGRVGGRPKGLPAKADATEMAAETLYRERRLSVNAIAEKLHISNSTPFTSSSGERLTRFAFLIKLA